MYLNVIMDVLQADSTLVNAVDYMIAEAPRVEMDLNGSKQTVICLYDSVVADDKWLSTYRDVKKSKVTISIDVVSSYGNNDSYCNYIIEYIYDMISDITSFSDVGWVLHTNNYNVDSNPTVPGRWQGTIKITCDYFEDT
jgi:hypothetical protein